MVRLVGVDLPRNKKITYSLTYIHGIGLTSAKKIVELANINPDTRTSDLTTEETSILRQTLEESELKLEGDLRRFNGLNITSLNGLSTTSLLILAGVILDLIREIENIYYSTVYNDNYK